MKTEDLILSIGGVSPEFLEQSETVPPKKRKTVLRIAFLAAAVIALGVTVAAFRRGHIFGMELKKTHNAVILKDDTFSASADIILDVKMADDAPSTLEEHYLPLLSSQGWENTMCSTNRFSSRIEWKKGTNYVIFRQLAQPDYTGQYSIDTVDLGYDANYKSGEECICGVDVFTVTVEPSQTPPDPGRRKHYWSDGRYVFILEVDYTMEKSIREAVFESIAQVNIEEYLIDASEAESIAVECETVETPMRPTEIPQGWIEAGGGLQPDGSYTYYWHLASEGVPTSVMEFVQTKDVSYYDSVVIDWERRTDAFTKGMQDGICIYTAQGQTQVLWKSGGYYFSLDSAGENPLSAQELLVLAKSVE